MGGGFRIVAEVAFDAGDNDGIIAALGDWSNGWALFVEDGRPTFAINLFGDLATVRSSSVAAEGARTITVTYRRRAAGGGPIQLAIDGEPVGEGAIEADLPFRWQIGAGGLLIGRDIGFPVSPEYEPPFPFAGEILGVTIESTALAALLGPADEVDQILHHE
jgi:arylsulfatase